VNVKDGKVVQITSAWEGPANHGWTCVKGRFGNDFVHHPDRLTKPLVRRKVLEAWKPGLAPAVPEGTTLSPEELVPTDWDTALDLVATRFMETKQKYGGDAWALLCSAKCTNEENYLMQKMTRQAMGTHNIDHCARL
jgi:predicted molibdopterin-dependent oxidoreductase YjgC